MALILFITCNRWPALCESDTLVAAALQALGHQVQPRPWQATVRVQRPEQMWLIQEFMPQIADGELSLVFIDGTFSHAIAKRPQPGEFWINSQYQGQITRVTPDAAVIEQAERVLAAPPAVPLYARVNGVVTAEGEFCLIELELNEPGLYFQYAPEQVVQLARVIDTKVA